jgi:hypothetical protein
MNRRGWAVFAVAVGCAFLNGCGPTSTNPTEKSQVSQVLPITGTNSSRVVLTPQAAARLGIKTDLVRKAPTAAGGAGAQNVILPTAAIVYESDGSVWVYATLPSTGADATTGSLAFVRQPVVVLRIEGDVAVLQSGPPAGTSVVTVGAAELLGTESGVEGGG